MVPGEYLTYSDFGLAPWKELAPKHARDAPPRAAKLSGTEPEEETLALIRTALRLLVIDEPRVITDCEARSVHIGERLVGHISLAVHRVPFAPWIDELVINPMEVWRRHVAGNMGEEVRRLYMASYRTPRAMHNVLAISGDDENVLFNFFDTSNSYLDRERHGEPLYVGY
jgi:hypothetical protein